MPETNELWTVFIQQAPGIVGNIAIVILFLKYGVSPFLEYLKSRDEQWLSFYKEQGENYSHALEEVTAAAAAISAEVKSGNALIQQTLKAIEEHDRWQQAQARRKPKQRTAV